MTMDKKIFLIRYLPWMVCFVLVAAVPAVSMADYIRIKGTVVNVRQGPGTSHPVLFQAEQGEEFDLVSIEGLWCLVKLPSGQEAWLFRKLVDVVQGDMPGMAANEVDSGEPDISPTGSTWVMQAGFLILSFLLAAVAIWKRREIMQFTGLKLREICGYKRDQAFRYDNRKPNNDSWEL